MVGSGLEWIKRLEQNLIMGDPADEHQVAMGMFLCIFFFFFLALGKCGAHEFPSSILMVNWSGSCVG